MFVPNATRHHPLTCLTLLWRTRMQRNNDHASGVLMDGGEQLHCQRGRVQPGYRVKRWPVWNLARREFQPGSVTGTNTFFLAY